MKKLLKDPFYDLFNNNLMFSPDVKITKNENDYQLLMSLPGLTKDDLEISIKDGEISISFTKDEEKENHYFVNKFTKKYIIPIDVNHDEIEGKVENGVLKITFPFKEKKQKVRYLSLN